MFKKRKKNLEAPLAAGMNFDLEHVQPFLKDLSSSVLDSGLTHNEINTLYSEIETMKDDNEIKEIGPYDVIYKGTKTRIRIIAEIHIEDDLREVVLNIYSTQELVKIIDKKMMMFADKLDM